MDGLAKCDKWIRDDDDRSEESKTSWWLNRLIGRTKKVSIDWPYPFAEEKLFVLTLSAGLEGYHINVDGRHVTSFPYRTVFPLQLLAWVQPFLNFSCVISFKAFYYRGLC